MSSLPHLLIVDSSRVVRVTLAKNLKDYFEIREEASAEFAWETLILDSSIVAVISGISLPKMDGIGLLEKIRSNKLERLKRLPFFLIASETMLDEIHDRAMSAGVSGFVPKGLGTAETHRVVRELLAGCGQNQLPESSTPISTSSGDSDVFGNITRIVPLDMGGGHEAAPEVSELALSLVARADFSSWLGQRVSFNEPGGLGLLLISMDHFAGLVHEFGPEMADRIGNRFGVMLAGKIGPSGKVVRIAADRMAVVVGEGQRDRCLALAEKICNRLAKAEVSVRGHHVDMSVSVGLACTLTDGPLLDGEAFLALAETRLEFAIRQGGNRVEVAHCQEAHDAIGRQQAMMWLTALLENSALTQPSKADLGEVGLLLMPVIRRMETSFGFGLPIEAMEQKLTDSIR